MNHPIAAGSGVATGYGPTLGAGQDLGQINRNMVMTRPPSLEERLEHLRRGCERLARVRAELGHLTERLVRLPPLPADPRPPGGPTPDPLDLSGKFGDAIGFVHTTADELELLVSQVRGALYDEKSTQCEVRRG